MMDTALIALPQCFSGEWSHPQTHAHVSFQPLDEWNWYLSSALLLSASVSQLYSLLPNLQGAMTSLPANGITALGRASFCWSAWPWVTRRSVYMFLKGRLQPLCDQTFFFLSLDLILLSVHHITFFSYPFTYLPPSLSFLFSTLLHIFWCLPQFDHQLHHHQLFLCVLVCQVTRPVDRSLCALWLGRIYVHAYWCSREKDATMTKLPKSRTRLHCNVG